MSGAVNMVETLPGLVDPVELRRFMEAHATELTLPLAQQLKARANEIISSNSDASKNISEGLIIASEITGNPLYRALGLMVRGNVFLLKGEHRAAIQAYDEAQQAALSAGDEVEAARSQTGKIFALMYLGEYDPAIEIANRTAETLAQHNDLFAAARVYGNAANCYNQLEKAELALGEYQKAQALLEQLDTREAQHNLALVLYNSAISLCELGHYHEALDYSQRACDLAHDLQLPADEALYRRASAICYSLMGHYNKALRLHLEARQVSAAGNLQAFRLHSEYFIAESYLELGRFEAAAEQVRELIKLLEEKEQLETWNGTRAYHTLGRALAGLEEYDEASEALLRAQEIAEKLGAQGFKQRTDLRLAEIYLSSGRVIEAEERLHKLLENSEDLRILPGSLLLLARLELERENYSEAQVLSQQALRQFEAQGINSQLYRGYWQLAQVRERQGDLQAASEYLERSLEELERLRAQVAAESRHQFLKQKEEIYEQAVAVALRRGEIQRGFALVERVKSRALVELVDNQLDIRIKVLTEDDRPLVEELEQLRVLHNDLTMRLSRWQFIATGERGERTRGAMQFLDELPALDQRDELSQKVLECERRMTALTESLQIKNARYAEDENLVLTFRPFDHTTLAEGEALVEYFAVQGEFMAFVVRRDGIRVVSLPATVSSLTRLLSLLHLNFGQVAKGSTQENLLSNARSFLGKFYSALFEPLEKELQGARYLRVVPHGLLHYLPFHALYKASEGKYLLELYEEISYAPAARLLERTRGEAQGRDALVFGYSGGGALPGTLEEAQSVYDILSNLGESRLAMEVEASLENFRKEAPSRRILHLAAHGSFREDAPLFSSVLLEGGELSAHELFNMELNASLLTLSCCESGLGAIGGGDEIMGLSRACLYAGVKSLVLSLWRVEDTASSRLMQDFYGELVKGQAKAAALCKAQLAMVHSVQYDHPYYWAPFVLIGDCGKI